MMGITALFAFMLLYVVGGLIIFAYFHDKGIEFLKLPTHKKLVFLALCGPLFWLFATMTILVEWFKED